MTINQIIDGVIEREGGFVDHPSDPGGATNWGITEKVARANGWAGAMRDLPRATAAAIYRKRYVEGPAFDRLAQIAPGIGEELVDTGVNMGPVVAGRFLQRALNGFSRGGRDYPVLLLDGQCGPATRVALQAFLTRRGQVGGSTVLLAALNGLQAEHYFSLAEANPKLGDFLFGWINTRVAA